MTGTGFPFATRDAIHYWIPSFYGTTLMQYLIPRWQPIEPRHMFLKHGLISLLDFSGQNYHQFTLNYIEDTTFIPLEKLAVDTTVNSNSERKQSGEAASLVDYLVFNFGIGKLGELYRSVLPFDSAVAQIYGMNVSEMQDHWLEFAHEAVKMDTTLQK
jgi:hypothetical protein